MDQIKIDNLKTFIEEIRKPEFIDDNQRIAMVPEGWKTEDMERFFMVPDRKRGAVVLTDSNSFIAYAKKHGSLANCVLYAAADYESQKISIKAVINDHGETEDDQNWRDFTATYAPIQTVEWKRWNEQNRKIVGQGDFATFIEDNIGDIATIEGMPTGTQMLSMALNFEKLADKRFKSKLDLSGGGVRLEFIDDEDKDTREKMEFFSRFSLGIGPFLNGDKYPLEARLKYRERDGKLTFWFELVRPDRVFEDAVKTEMDKIKAATGFMVLFGTP